MKKIINKVNLREALLKYWDPIGVKGMTEAEDEYDNYINQINYLLLTKNFYGLKCYLNKLECYMGLNPRPQKELQRIVTQIIKYCKV